jgi:cell division protein FtsA
MAEVTPSRFTMSTLAAAEAVLTQDERELGVGVIDLGAASTGLACYVAGQLAQTVVLPVGGQHLTQDLAKVFQTPLAQAERIKVTSGHALPELDDDPSAEVDVVPFGEGERRVVTRRSVSEVLAARVDEIADMIQKEMAAAGLADRLPAGIVLVGGGTELAGLPRRFRDRLSMPVRVGRPTHIIGLSEATRGPDHAAAVGLLLWRARGLADAATGVTDKEAEPVRMTRLTTWLKDAFVPARNGRH